MSGAAGAATAGAAGTVAAERGGSNSSTSGGGGGDTGRRPWGRAAGWLLLLAPLFFASYGLATWLAGRRAEVGFVTFGWERHIPLLPWTIIPYWSIDVLYGISLFVCTSRAELDAHARRLLTAQVVAVTCFILFPLRFSFPRPELDGVPGALFTLLASFDKPFNQAPSLHIALLVILWVRYAHHVSRRWSTWLLHLWFALIGLSVLTTYQHHFIDVPTGALLGFLCLWVWPDEGASPLARLRVSRDPKRRKLALRYGLGGCVLAIPAIWLGGFGLWLLWPAVSLALVALNYAAIGAPGFQKGADGRLSLAAACLFAPYLLGAWINTKLWPGDGRRHAALQDGVSVGRIAPGAAINAAGFTAVVDLCAELPGPGRAGAAYASLPMLDLVTPTPARLREAADAIERARRHGPVLVCCALGYSRSAAAAAAWLLTTGRAKNVEAAVAQVREARPHLVLDAAARSAIAEAATAGVFR